MAHEHRGSEVRCHCRRLVCIIHGDEVHLKCGRCKRVLVIRTRGVESILFAAGPALMEPPATGD